MARSGRRVFLVAAVAALTLLAAPLSALAAFAVRIEGPGFTSTVADDGPGDSFNLTPNLIGASAIIAGSILSANFSLSNTPGGPLSSFLSLNWSLLSTGSAVLPIDPVTVTASATGYTFPPSGVGSVLTSNVVGTFPFGTGSATPRQWVDLGDNLFAPIGPPLVEHGSFTATFGDTKSTRFVASTSYSINDQVVLTLGPSSLSTGTLTSTVVPEPITMFLGGTGVLMLGYAARRRLFGR